MEKHIFKFGDSSLAIIIPKKWADKHGLKASSSIQLDEDEGSNLVLSSTQVKSREAERTIAQDLDPQLLARWVGLHYMYGTKKLTIYSKTGFTQQQFDSIEDKINAECHGFEITNQAKNQITIEDFTNIKEIDIGKVVLRLKSLLLQEFDEIKKGNLGSIEKIEKLVNRSYMLGVRYIDMTQAKDSLRYLIALELMEGIADNLNALSETEMKGMDIFNELNDQFVLALSGFAGDTKAIEKVADMRKEVKRKLLRSKFDRYQKHLLGEITDQSGRIAEFGLKLETKQPGEFIIPVEK